MILGIMSDSHGDEAAVKRAVDVAGEIDLWLHAGDLCVDADLLAAYSGKKVISVAGNCDGLAAPCKVDEFMDIEGKMLWLTHGHKMRVKTGVENLIAMAEMCKVDIVIYGHTHMVDISEYGKITVLNPGSIARPYGTKPSFMKVRLEKDVFLPQVIEVR